MDDSIKQTLINEVFHLLAAIAIMLITYLIFASLPLSLVSGLVALFIDFDHLFEYYLAEGLNFNLKKFISGKHIGRLGRAYVLLHAWEWVILLTVICFIFAEPLFLAVSLGLTSHYLVDIVTNKVKPVYYFLIHRIRINFSLEDFNG